MRRRSRTRRRFAFLALAAFALGIAGAPSVRAQEAAEPDLDQFGGVIASARGNGLQVTYDSPNLVATGSPVVQFSVPEALATISSGPVGYALASFLFPGPLIADLDAALSATGQSTGIPPYPIRSEAFFPAGPTEASEGEQGVEMSARTDAADSEALASYAGLSLDPAAYVGGMASRSQSVVLGDQLVTRARSEVTDISIAGGLIAIDSVVTDLVATSNGSAGATDCGAAGGGRSGVAASNPPPPPPPPDGPDGVVGVVVGTSGSNVGGSKVNAGVALADTSATPMANCMVWTFSSRRTIAWGEKGIGPRLSDGRSATGTSP